MELITSKLNEKVKFVKNLNEKKYRNLENSFYIEGIKVVNEAIDMFILNEININFIVISKEILKNVNGGLEIISRIEKLYNENKIKVYEFERNIFKSVTDTITPQGILAIIEIPKYSLDECLNQNSNILLLDKVQDMGNLGTILRTANAFNVNTIFCIKGTADVYSPKVVRSTMSSILRQKVIYISEAENLIFFQKLKNIGYNIIGTALQTDKYIQDLDFKNSKNCFVIGNEANGISNGIIKECDFLVKIPIEKQVDSLNVSVATSIFLYEQYIQNRK